MPLHHIPDPDRNYTVPVEIKFRYVTDDDVGLHESHIEDWWMVDKPEGEDLGWLTREYIEKHL